MAAPPRDGSERRSIRCRGAYERTEDNETEGQADGHHRQGIGVVSVTRDIPTTPTRRFLVRLVSTPRGSVYGDAARLEVDAWDEADQYFSGQVEIPREILPSGAKKGMALRISAVRYGRRLFVTEAIVIDEPAGDPS